MTLTATLAIFNLGPMELFLILFIVVLLFGARRLPELGRSLGEGIKNFRGSMKNGASEEPKDGSAPRDNER